MTCPEANLSLLIYRGLTIFLDNVEHCAKRISQKYDLEAHSSRLAYLSLLHEVYEEQSHYRNPIFELDSCHNKSNSISAIQNMMSDTLSEPAKLLLLAALLAKDHIISNNSKCFLKGNWRKMRKPGDHIDI